MNSEKFIEFLKKLRSDAGRPVFVIADNARYHHSKMVQSFLKEQHGNIMMAFLPPYSPQLNPDEQVWNHAKREIGKTPIRSKEIMEKAILSVMATIQKKADLVKSFFCMPDTEYATINKPQTDRALQRLWSAKKLCHSGQIQGQNTADMVQRIDETQPEVKKAEGSPSCR